MEANSSLLLLMTFYFHSCHNVPTYMCCYVFSDHEQVALTVTLDTFLQLFDWVIIIIPIFYMSPFAFLSSTTLS
jgi:hypothetical protein